MAPIAHAGGAERAAIAASVAENSPGVAQVVAVLAQHFKHLDEMVGMLLIEPVRDQAHTFRTPSGRRRHGPSLCAITVSIVQKRAT